MTTATHRGHDVAAIERAVAICGEHGFRATALADRLTAAGARVHAHAFMPLPDTPLAGAEPTPIGRDIAAAVARLEARGAAYGEWRALQVTAQGLVQLRRAARGRAE